MEGCRRGPAPGRREREAASPPSVPRRDCSRVSADPAVTPAEGSLALSRSLSAPPSPPTGLSSHLRSVLYIKGVFFFFYKEKKKQTNRDICIEMFYSELLLMECSEAEPGEGAGEAAAAAQRGRGNTVRARPEVGGEGEGPDPPPAPPSVHQRRPRPQLATD